MWPFASSLEAVDALLARQDVEQRVVRIGLARVRACRCWNIAPRSDRRPCGRSHLVPTSSVRLLSGGRFAVLALSDSDSADGLNDVP